MRHRSTKPRPRRAPMIGLGTLICLALASPPTLAAQTRTTLGLRAGGGTDWNGNTAYVGQVDATELYGSNSVAVGLQGFRGLHKVSDYTVGQAVSTVVHAHHEELSAWGIGLSATYLWRHSPQTAGPYFLGGLGVGPLRAAWRHESPTDLRLGTPMPGGGSFYEEEVWTLGTTLSVGIGQRLREHFDIRAQMLVVLVPSTDKREELELLRTFALTTGVAF